MKIVKFVLMGLCIYMIPVKAHALTFCTSSSESSVAIFFGNGVNTTREEARVSLRQLEDHLRVTSPDQFTTFEFTIAYNPTANLILDLWESAHQRLDGEAAQFLRMLNGIEAMPDWFQDLVKEKAARIVESELVGNQTLQEHATLYRAKVLEGKKVIIVAHSQGNFFANAAYAVLYEGENTLTTRSVGIVSVANPASFVGGNFPYTTLTNDLVVASIRTAALVPPLPVNVTNNTAGNDILGHSFIGAYLFSGSISNAKITGDFATILMGLEAPTPVASSGIITVTLTWGTEPDVDLHVFEPNGTHVYYANLFGPSGYLDVDDVTSFGPEHYFISCNTLETGQYAVGINYYSGGAPENALVQVQAGLTIRSFVVHLPGANGFLGDANPIRVATITAVKDPQGGFVFEIQ